MIVQGITEDEYGYRDYGHYVYDKEVREGKIEK